VFFYGAFSALMPLRNEEQGGIVPPHSVVAPESALGSLASVALSSAQVLVVVGGGAWLVRHCSSNSCGVR
jgi:hypothetical protein